MPGIERIWRITTDSQGRIEVRLSQSLRGATLSLERDGEQLNGSLDVDVARNVAQAMLEACEVASALSEQTIAIPTRR